MGRPGNVSLDAFRMVGARHDYYEVVARLPYQSTSLTSRSTSFR
jgi:hypothetical protein